MVGDFGVREGINEAPRKRRVESRVGTHEPDRSPVSATARRLAPLRFETEDERYAWLNSVVAVGQGRVASGAAEYLVYHVVND